jgi:hypothetical protein
MKRPPSLNMKKTRSGPGDPGSARRAAPLAARKKQSALGTFFEGVKKGA